MATAWQKAPLNLSASAPSQQQQQPASIITFDVAPNQQQKQQNQANDRHNKELAKQRADDGEDGQLQKGDASRGESKRDRDENHNDHKQRGHRTKPSDRS